MSTLTGTFTLAMQQHSTTAAAPVTLLSRTGTLQEHSACSCSSWGRVCQIGNLSLHPAFRLNNAQGTILRLRTENEACKDREQLLSYEVTKSVEHACMKHTRTPVAAKEACFCLA